MKFVSLFLLLCFIILPGFSETIFVYTYEVCNDEPVPCEFQVKEGILDGLFDAGHIVFDDMSDSVKGDSANALPLSGTHIEKLITEAKNGGAYYLVGVRIETKLKPLENKTEYIESIAFYCLYDVSTGKLIQQGNTKMTNLNNEDHLSRGILWFRLGLFISGEITRFYDKR